MSIQKMKNDNIYLINIIQINKKKMNKLMEKTDLEDKEISLDSFLEV